jgi:uncharacterized protein (TIGR04255 family)
LAVVVLNWRANYGSEYPHYRELEPRFMRNWALLQNAVAERSLGELQPITAEVTYINRFTLEDDETLFDVLPVLRSNSHFEKSEPTIQLTTAIVTADGPGQYGEQNISAARSRDEKREVQLMSVTRVGFFLGESDPITKALRRAHASAVTKFAQVTTGKMHQRWGRTQ